MGVQNWRTRLGAWVGGFGVPGGFDATSSQRRLKGFVSTRAHFNALIAASGPEMNARARWLVRNNGYPLSPKGMSHSRNSGSMSSTGRPTPGWSARMFMPSRMALAARRAASGFFSARK